jgi:hypothetical protein
MNEDELQILLENLNFSPTEMPVYQNRLRCALVALGEKRTFHAPSWVAFKDRLTDVFRSRRFTLIGSGAVLAIVAILSFVFLSSQESQYARAQGLVNQSIKTMQSLSPEAKARFDEDFGPDPFDFLEQAKQSKDLEILTKDEWKAELQKHGIGGFSFNRPLQPENFPFGVTKYLRYTNPSEKIVLLGLNDNDALIYAVKFTSEFLTQIKVGDIDNLD